MRKEYDCLRDRFWHTCLINVRVERNLIMAGFAYFSSGSAREIDLFSDDLDTPICRIRQPDEAKNCPTYLTLTSPSDCIELEIIKL